MSKDRIQANILYAITLIIVCYIFYNSLIDKQYPTGVIKVAVIEKAIPKYSKYKPKMIITMNTEDGVKIVKVVNASLAFQVGDKVELREFKAKISGTKKYVIIR